MNDLQEIKLEDGRKLFGRLAKIESCELMIEDHGILTVMVQLSFGGSGQGFGGYALDEYHKPWERRRGTSSGADFIIQLLLTFKASKLSELKNRYCFALYTEDSWNATVRGLMTTPQDGSRTFLVSDWLKQWGIDTE